MCSTSVSTDADLSRTLIARMCERFSLTVEFNGFRKAFADSNKFVNFKVDIKGNMSETDK